VFEESLLYAVKPKNSSMNSDVVTQIVKEYEGGLIKRKLDNKLVECLYEHYAKKRQVTFDKTVKVVSDYIKNHNNNPDLLADLFPNHFHFEIVKNFRFNPVDKISFEWGKILYSKGNYQGAIMVLESITQKVNSDWRSVYRSFYLLSEIYKKIDNPTKHRYYKKLCRISNPSFPLL